MIVFIGRNRFDLDSRKMVSNKKDNDLLVSGINAQTPIEKILERDNKSSTSKNNTIDGGALSRINFKKTRGSNINFVV